MAKKLISIDDSKTGEAALPDAVNTALRATYVRQSDAAALGRAPGLLAYGGFTAVADHAQLTAENAQRSNGTDTAQNSRVRHDMTCRASVFRFVYGNFQSGATGAGEVFDQLAPITVKAAIETADGLIAPVYFNGAETVTIAPGALIASDPVSVGNIPDSTHVWSRTYVTVASGGRWPMTTIVSNPVRAGEGVESGTAVTDKAYSGTIPTGNTRAFGPLAVLGVTTDRVPFVVTVGDSINVGLNDDITAQGGNKVLGYIDRALTSTPHLKLSISGETAADWRVVSKSARRRRFFAGASHLLCTYGINDVRANRTEAQIKADLTAIWQEAADLGMKVYQTTITPHTTSTDNWATTTNQTFGDPGQNAIRVAVNDWIRSKPAPLTGYVEIADVVETARNSGLWKPTAPTEYTKDGLHPSTPAHILMASRLAEVNFTLG